MNRKFSFFILVLISIRFLTGCNNDDLNKNSVIVQKDSTINLQPTADKIKEINDTVSVISSNQIIGTWKDLGKEELTVEIAKDKIFYREHNELHYFKIKSDSIYVYYPDFELVGRPYLIKDTFVIELGNGMEKLNMRG